MAGAGRGDGQGPAVGKLESQIYCIKYSLFCFNVVLWLFGVSIFALCLWICIEPGFNEWMRILELQKYFIGIYIILIASLGIMVVAFLGCGSALMENVVLLYGFIATQIALFVFGLIGACVVLDFSTYDSSVQPLIKDVIMRLMNNPQHEGSREILRMVQEGIGCCGADGPMDFLNLNKPLPSECRDSVTGNAYFHGCVDELTWYLEGKTGWLAGIVLASCMICVPKHSSKFMDQSFSVEAVRLWNALPLTIRQAQSLQAFKNLVVNAVMSMVLIQAVKKEEDEAIVYKN